MNALTHQTATFEGPGVRPVPLVEEAETGLFARSAPWALAALVTLAIHGGAFWWMTRDHAAPAIPVADTETAVMIDMAPEVQQAFSQTDQAVGQPMQESAEEPPPPPDPPVDNIPHVETAPVEAVAPLPPKPVDPPKEKPKPKPKVKIPPKPVKPVEKKQTKAAPATAGAPRSDSRAERTTASSAGIAASAAAVVDWKTLVAAAINRYKRYPNSGATGSPTVRLSVASSGAVGNVSIVASSGSPDLDAAATETVRRASPFPPPPGGAATLTFRINFLRH